MRNIVSFLLIRGSDYITTTTHYDLRFIALVSGVRVEVTGSCESNNDIYPFQQILNPCLGLFLPILIFGQ